MMYREVLLLCVFVVKYSNTHMNQFEGELCMGNDGAKGVCIKIIKCKSALKDIELLKLPKTCSFEGYDPIVCCFDKPEETATTVRAISTTPLQLNTSADQQPETTAYWNISPNSSERTDSKFLGVETITETISTTQCPPRSSNMTAPEIGKKAWRKCIEYQEQLVFPCMEGTSKRANYCWNHINTFILGGTDAFQGEFSHMALIGYGEEINDLAFLCGGTLISDRFILTAGHCSSSRNNGPLKYILAGILKRSEYNQSNIYKVKTIHKHPQYRPPIKYNDIVLLETESRIKLNEFLVPACLDLGDAMAVGSKAIATGWGVTSHKGEMSDILQKVSLTKFDNKECIDRYTPSRTMRNGFDPATQLCYGDRKRPLDTCQGDSGGPLQVKNEKIDCMYNVVGITSFGRGCGMIGEPALYTKVAAYLTWIEDIVWPDDTL